MSPCQKLTWIAALAAANIASAAGAMTVAPMQVEMVSTGPRSHAQISVINNSDHPLPVDTVIQRLDLDEAGHQSTSEAGEEFLVMPPQALIPPGATQNFRVQWLGDPMLASSQSFIIYLNQIPVKLPTAATGVQVVTSMGVLLNVAPAQGTPSLQVIATGISLDQSGSKRFPTITVRNASSVHALLPQATIHLSSGDWSMTLPPQDLGDRLGIGLVQPGKNRTFKLPVELPATVSKVRASLDLSARRSR